MTPVQAATQARLERITKQLESEYGLDGWLDVRHVFDTGYDGDTTLENDGSQMVYPTTAITTPSFKYRCARIRWFLNVAAPQSDSDLEAIATHEYMHAVLAPLTIPHHKSMSADMEELVAETLTRIICRVRGMENVH